MKKKIIYIIIESVKRELNSKTLLALKALKKNYRVLIGQKGALREVIKDTNPGIMILKSFGPKNTKHIDFIKKKKFKVVSTDEELITAIDLVNNKKLKNAFCAVRPPGHHAEYDKAMGFCIFNNVAVGANYLIEKYKYNRVAIIDFDVHHGNGTQNIFFSNEKVLYISTHQYPHFPGTGSTHDKGSHNNILNIPLAAGTNSEEYFNAYDHVLKKLNKFKPEFILLSAGFDAHFRDPLSNINLKSSDYYEITKRTLAVSKRYCEGKVVSILEGGYDLQALAESTEEHLKAMIEFKL